MYLFLLNQGVTPIITLIVKMFLLLTMKANTDQGLGLHYLYVVLYKVLVYPRSIIFINSVIVYLIIWGTPVLG